MNSQSLFFLPILGAALACLDRYVGVSLVLTGSFSILFLSQNPAAERLKKSFLFAVLGILPLALWFFRNFLSAQTVVDRTPGFHFPEAYQFQAGWETLARWILSEPVPMKIAGIATLFVLIFTLWVSFVIFKRKEEKTVLSSPGLLFPKVLLIFIFCYAATFLGYVLFLSVNVLPVSRHLSGIFVAGLLYGLFIFYEYWKRPLPKLLRQTLVLFAVLFCLSYLTRGIKWSMDLYRDGLQFSSRYWKLSETIQAAKNLPKDRLLYTNSPEGIYFQIGRPAYLVPKKYDRSAVRKSETTEIRKDYSEKLSEMAKILKETDGRLIYFDLESKEMGRWFLPGPGELAEKLSLVIEEEFSDGKIYRLP